MKAAPIRIIDTDFNLLGEIDDYESFSITRRYHTSGDFFMIINRNKANALELIQDRILFLSPDRAGIIRSVELELEPNGRESVIVKGSTLETFAGQRISCPPSGQSHQSYSNTSAETIMKGLLSANLINPVDTDRKIDFCQLDPDQGRGPIMSFQTRFRNLEEELEKLSMYTGLGLQASLDFDAKKIIFEVVEGLDRTYGNGINSHAIFSPSFDNVKSQYYINSNFGKGTFAYVGGQGEGTERAIITTGSGQGLNRREIFVDARDLEDVANLPGRGQLRLDEMPGEHAFHGEILTQSNLEYRKDYDLGDLVTVDNRAWGLRMNERITEITEIYEVNGGFRLSAVFGHQHNGLAAMIRNEIAELQNEMTK